MSSQVYLPVVVWTLHELYVYLYSVSLQIPVNLFHRKPPIKVKLGCMVNFAVQNVTTRGVVATHGPTWAKSAVTVRSWSTPTDRGPQKGQLYMKNDCGTVVDMAIRSADQIQTMITMTVACLIAVTCVRSARSLDTAAVLLAGSYRNMC